VTIDWQNIFLAAEIGNENKTTDDTDSFYNKGIVSKAGFDYNAYENWLNMENIISWTALWFQYF
jgi:hypothetical protein